MFISAETLKQDIEKLNPSQRQQVADFIAFVKFRDNRHRVSLDSTQMAELFAEFADEDRALAESGMDDYEAMLDREDKS
jgi:hypothetical protein